MRMDRSQATKSEGALDHKVVRSESVDSANGAYQDGTSPKIRRDISGIEIGQSDTRALVQMPSAELGIPSVGCDWEFPVEGVDWEFPAEWYIEGYTGNSQPRGYTGNCQSRGYTGNSQWERADSEDG